MSRRLPPLAILPLLALLLGPARARAGDLELETARRLMSETELSQALWFAGLDEGATVEDAIRLCEIPSPPFGEAARAVYFRDRLIELGLEDVHIDEVGNVIGTRAGTGAGPVVILAAHLDTVFPEGTRVEVTRRGDRLYGPGIGDDCAGLATLLGVLRALDSIHARTKGTLVIVGTVGEEGLGDLRGAKHLMTRGRYRGGIDAFVAVDGAGPDRLTYKALGSLRYRVTFSGPGGHSWQDFGMANPVHALGRAIQGLLKADLPRRPLVSYNVGRVGGGTSVNSIAAEAWMEVDLRSTDRDELVGASETLESIVERAARDERRFGARARKPLTVSIEKIGDRPSGEIERHDPIVQVADAVIRAMGGKPFHTGPTSSDSNVPISLGIPALTLGTGGESGGAHSPGEWLDVADFSRGVKQLLLVAVMLAEYDEGTVRGVD